MKKMTVSIIMTSIILVGGMNSLFAQDSNSLEGYSAGLNVSYPVVSGAYFDGDGTTTGPSVGVVVDTPYGFDLGPFAVGVGAGIEIANMGADDDFTYTGFYISLESTVYELSQGPISVYGGVGMYGGLAATGAVTFDYAVSGQPIVIQPYARTTVLLDASGNGDKSYLMSIGAMINYSF